MLSILPPTLHADTIFRFSVCRFPVCGRWFQVRERRCGTAMLNFLPTIIAQEAHENKSHSCVRDGRTCIFELMTMKVDVASVCIQLAISCIQLATFLPILKVCTWVCTWVCTRTRTRTRTHTHTHAHHRVLHRPKFMCAVCPVTNSCRWHRTGDGRWLCNKCHSRKLRTGHFPNTPDYTSSTKGVLKPANKFASAPTVSEGWKCVCFACVWFAAAL